MLVVMAASRVGAELHAATQAVLGQTFQAWRLVIAGDRAAVTQALGMAGADQRIQVVDAAERPCLALDAVLGSSAARFVNWLEPDAVLEPTALEKWLWLLTSEVSVDVADAHVCRRDDGIRARFNGWGRGAAGEFGPRAAMIRAEAIRHVGGIAGELRGAATDCDLWLRLAASGVRSVTLPEVLVSIDESISAPARGRGSPGPFPPLEFEPHLPNAWLSDHVPWRNPLIGTKPRLLLLLPWMAVGGADKFNLDLLDQLRERGWDATIAATLSADTNWLPLFRSQTRDFFVLPSFLRLADYPRFLRYLIESRQPDIVLITNSEFGYRILPYLRAVCDVPFVDYCHSEIERWNSGGYPRLSVQYHNLLDLTITASGHLTRWLVDRGVSKERVQTCFIGSDTYAFRPDALLRAEKRREYGLRDTPTILFVGRVSEDKQPTVLAHTLRELRRRRAPFVALIAGDGPDLPWLRRFVRRHRLKNHVRLLGAVTEEQVAALMNAADVFFLPSLWEGIALTLYEALSTGTPVVAADVGGQRELVSPACGILVPHGTPKQEVRRYADALAALLADPARREAMGRAGRARIEGSFDLDTMGEIMVKLFDRAIELHRIEPRDPVSPGLAKAIATEVVEYTRLAAAGGAWIAEAKRSTWSTRLRMALLLATRRVVGPFYRSAASRGLTWLVPIKERFVRRLVP